MKTLIRSTLLFIAVGLIFSSPVYADTPDPDSVVIDEAYGGIFVNRNLLENGDALFYFTPSINYTTIPDLAIDEAFIFQLIDTDNTTVLASREGYNFVTSGYGPNINSFYFDNVTAPTWGQSYTIRITGKPSAFDTPPIYNFPVSIGDYTTETTQVANAAELRSNIIYIAQRLSISMATDLLDQGEVGTVLSLYGEELFRNTIPGIQAMAPSLFAIVLNYPNWTPRAWSENQSDNYSSTYIDTDEGDAVKEFFKAMVNADIEVGLAFPIIALCITFIAISAKMSEKIHAGLIWCSAAVIIASPQGWVPMAAVSIIALVMAFYSSFRLFRPS